MPTQRECRVPGCKNIIGGKNYSGVCREHNHAAGYCACYKCGPLPASAREIEKQRVDTGPDRKTIHVPIISVSGAYRLTVPITLPRAPWETP